MTPNPAVFAVAGRHARAGACEEIETRRKLSLVMAGLDRAIQEKPKHFN
jgi:hypothetical protein